MDKIIDKFYNGSVQTIQNGGYEKPRLTSNIYSSPNLLENKYNRTIGNTYNQRYSNGQRIMENAPIPRTQYSMGLNAPTIRGNPPISQSMTNPFRSIENPYSTIRHNYEPNQLKMNLLNNRIREMEDETARNRLKIQRLMEGSSFSPEKPYWNSNPNYANNPNNLSEAMNNLRNPYLTMDEFKNKQDMRRNIVQYELERARQRMNAEKPQIIIQPNQKEEKNYTLSNYSSNEDNESSMDELDKKMKKDYDKLIKEIKKEREYNEMQEDNMNNIEEKLMQMERQNIYNNEEFRLLREKNQEMYNALKSKEEAEDFINNIPDHVALQLQNDNFKIRSNLNTIKEGFREIKNDLENKLESLELKQNYNFEIIKKIIEEGGNRKMRAGFRKYMNNEEIDLDAIQDELPEHLQFLPYLIEQKIKENEELKNRERNRLINERMNQKFDNMEYNYGYANDFYKYKNKYQPFNKQNKSNDDFVISKNYGRFQYIPKKNTSNFNNRSNNFRESAEQNLEIMKEREGNIPGLYAYGAGSKNMDNRKPVVMNGTFDDWFKDKSNQQGEYKIEETASDVGINAIKKKIKTKSNQSKSLKSKGVKKSESSKSKSENKKVSNKKENKKKDKNDDKKKDKKEDDSDEDSEESEESDEDSEKKSKDKDDKENKDKGSDKESESDEDSDDEDDDDDDDE